MAQIEERIWRAFSDAREEVPALKQRVGEILADWHAASKDMEIAQLGINFHSYADSAVMKSEKTVNYAAWVETPFGRIWLRLLWGTKERDGSKHHELMARLVAYCDDQTIVGDAPLRRLDWELQVTSSTHDVVVGGQSLPRLPKSKARDAIYEAWSQLLAVMLAAQK